MDINDRVRELMELRNWSEYRLAKEAGLPQSTISHLFKRSNSPTLPTIEAICRAFGITTSHFFSGNDEAMVLTPVQKELLFLWGGLTEEQQEIIKNILVQFCNK